MRRRSVVVASVIVAVPVLWAIAWWQRPDGTVATDRTARIVAQAVSWPRQDSAARLLNAVLDTRAGRSGGIAVVKADDLKAGTRTDPMAELVFHMHSDASEGWFGHVDAMDACYRATFNHYGVMGEPGRIHCPEDLTPLRPIPLPPRVDPFVESYSHPEDAP